MAKVQLLWRPAAPRKRDRYRCLIDGRQPKGMGRGKRGPMIQVLALLLMTPPPRLVTWRELIEYVYPDPDAQPDWGYGVIQSTINRWRAYGVNIETGYYSGWCIPASARG